MQLPPAVAVLSTLSASRACADELDDALAADDEVPDLRSGTTPRRRTKPSESTRNKDYTEADVRYAYADIVALKSGLEQVDKLLRASDLASVAPLLARPPFSSFKANALALVQGPGLGAEEKKEIGTEKRFGLAADVLITLNGLTDAVESADAPTARSYASKAKAALDEILAVCKGALG